MPLSSALANLIPLPSQSGFGSLVLFLLSPFAELTHARLLVTNRAVFSWWYVPLLAPPIPSLNLLSFPFPLLQPTHFLRRVRNCFIDTGECDLHRVRHFTEVRGLSLSCFFLSLC